MAKLYLTTGDTIFSNRSNVMLRIIDDTVGRHDFLLTPCSADTFRIIYGEINPHGGCFENLLLYLAPYGVTADAIPTTFNIFMNVAIDANSGKLSVHPPMSNAGDSIRSKRCKT